MPGGSLTSKPTWSYPFGFDHVGFFFGGLGRLQPPGMNSMPKPHASMAQQIAAAASAFEQRRTGHTPRSVTVVLSVETLVITVHGSLSPAEQALAHSPEGAAQVQEFHRQLFANSCNEFRQEIKRITGVEVREATAQIETTSGTVVQVFTTGTMVQVFLLAHGVPPDTWTGSGQADSS